MNTLSFRFIAIRPQHFTFIQAYSYQTLLSTNSLPYFVSNKHFFLINFLNTVGLIDKCLISQKTVLSIHFSQLFFVKSPLLMKLLMVTYQKKALHNDEH